jgi:membrane-bound ClpP family serine protease
MADGMGMALHLFSIRGIIAFFMLFGWTGYILSLRDLHAILVFLIAFVAGSIMLVLVGLIYYFLMKISQDGNLILTDAIGKEGNVYIPIPNRNEGTGKIQIIVGESLRTLNAIAKDKSIKTGQQVTVVGIVNGMLEVEENK